MKKRAVLLTKCKVGEVIAEDLYNREGILIAPRNTVLSSNNISRLLDMGFVSAEVFVSSDMSAAEAEAFVKHREYVIRYEHKLRGVKDILNGIASGNQLNLRALDKLSDAVYSDYKNKDSILKCLLEMKETDNYTYNHSLNVSLYAMLASKWLGLDEEKIKELVKCGLLHDVGKMKIPLEILNKKQKLEDWEFEEIKKHSLIGYKLLENLADVSPNIKKVILNHHERIDGSGYPCGLSGEDIDFYSKIIAVCDAYDAITSTRVYKPRRNPFETFKILENTGYGHFDYTILNNFLQHIAVYYIGSRILLSNGMEGEVVSVLPSNISNPIIKLDEEYINLSERSELTIIELKKK